MGILERFLGAAGGVELLPGLGQWIEAPVELAFDNVGCGIGSIIPTCCHALDKPLGWRSEPHSLKGNAKLDRDGLNPFSLLRFGKDGVDNNGVARRENVSSFFVKNGIDCITGTLSIGIGRKPNRLSNSV